MELLYITRMQLALKLKQPNALNFFNIRRSKVCVPHYEHITIPYTYNIEESLNKWILKHLKGRYFVGTTIDISTRLPSTPNVMQEEISAATGVHLGAIRVYNEGEFVEEAEEIEEEKTEERESVLADADYSEAEKVKHDENYGNEFVSKFVKNLPKSELHKEYKV